MSQVVTEARIDRTLILPEEIEYIREHVLKKPLRIIHIWALGVGVVIAGEYFGWNFGLPVGGPLGVLIASLIVCVLYLAWVLGLSELSVAIPFAGGPLAYGRRAVLNWSNRTWRQTNRFLIWTTKDCQGSFDDLEAVVLSAHRRPVLSRPSRCWVIRLRFRDTPAFVDLFLFFSQQKARAKLLDLVQKMGIPAIDQSHG